MIVLTKADALPDIINAISITPPMAVCANFLINFVPSPSVKATTASVAEINVPTTGIQLTKYIVFTFNEKNILIVLSLYQLSIYQLYQVK